MDTVADIDPVLAGVVEVGRAFFPLSFKGSRSRKDDAPTADRTSPVRNRRAMIPGLPHRRVPVLTALDSSGRVHDAILSPLTGIEAALEGRIASGSVLCSDGTAAYIAVAQQANVEHFTVLALKFSPDIAKSSSVGMSTRTTTRLTLQHLSSYHQRFKELINKRCRGVATKYLDRYLGWHRAMLRNGFEGRTLLTKALAGSLRAGL